MVDVEHIRHNKPVVFLFFESEHEVDGLYG